MNTKFQISRVPSATLTALSSSFKPHEVIGLLLLVIRRSSFVSFSRLLKGLVIIAKMEVAVVIACFVYWQQGLDVEDGRLQLISEVIKSCLGVDCAVLMGANIASEVAKQQFCEATIGRLLCKLERLCTHFRHIFCFKRMLCGF